MKRNNRRVAKKRRLTIISLLLAVFVFASCVTVGYAYFSDDLTVNVTVKTTASPMSITAIERSGVPEIPNSIGYNDCVDFNETKQNWVVSAMRESYTTVWAYSWTYYTFIAYEISLDGVSGLNTRTCTASIADTALSTPTVSGGGYSLVKGLFEQALLDIFDVNDSASNNTPSIQFNNIRSLTSASTTMNNNETNYTSASALPVKITISNPNLTDIKLTDYSAEIGGVADALIAMDAISEDTPVVVPSDGTADIIATIRPQTDGTFENGEYVITLTDELGYDYTVTIQVG